ncbi:MAG: LPXTG cell wall anchor domain-containing protein [Ruminococcus sp.]|nr:LPXTG cell wall anchor domain-containing protein [Ruminococcus sp.]
MITLTDDSGNVLDTYVIDPTTGIGTDVSDAEVNLPQTGNNSMKNVLIAFSAMTLMVIGAFAVKTSGIIYRKKDEK